MRIVLQRVTKASVEVDGQEVGSIGRGYLMLLGVADGDTEAVADKMIEKVFKLRIFEDSDGKTNLSIDQVNGEILVVSQFTLYADCKKGNRPSFTSAGDPETAERLYEYVLEKCRGLFKRTQQGIFGADMKVSLVNDGPFTVILDSREIVAR
ncbi:MAG: D-tyrosyl-tRNA(Tyr) deacylase [Ruminococcaceae bacterium]|nr:D-tyrosyl-tRNA(Tyr) deacylase [Oscillospiraceae bacterium]